MTRFMAGAVMMPAFDCLASVISGDSTVNLLHVILIKRHGKLFGICGMPP